MLESAVHIAARAAASGLWLLANGVRNVGDFVSWEVGDRIGDAGHAVIQVAIDWSEGRAARLKRDAPA